MSKILLVFVSLVLCNGLMNASSSKEEWNYANKGEDYWAAAIKQCRGKAQSPVNIIRKSTNFNPSLRRIRVENLDENILFNVTNTQFTVKFTPQAGQPAVYFSGSDFQETFQLLQFHFHWGENEYQGSEHFVDGYKYPAEVHLVTQSPTGKYAVFGFLFRLRNRRNSGLNEFFTAIEELKDFESVSQNSRSLKLTKFLPDSYDKAWRQYYRYAGSFTTPPCTEGVTWNVIRETHAIPVSRAQLEAFRVNDVKRNFRSPQRKYSRRVQKSF